MEKVRNKQKQQREQKMVNGKMVNLKSKHQELH